MPEPWVYTVASSRGGDHDLSGIQIVGAGSGIDRAGQGADGARAVSVPEERDLLLFDEAEVLGAVVDGDCVHLATAERRASSPQFDHVVFDVHVEVVHADPGTLSGPGCRWRPCRECS